MNQVEFQTSFFAYFCAMEKIELDISRVYDFISADEINNLAEETMAAQQTLHRGMGMEMTFWAGFNCP